LGRVFLRKLFVVAKDRAYRWLYALLFASPLYSLFANWFSFGTINLATAVYYFTMPLFIIAALLAGFLKDRVEPSLSPRSLARFGLYSLVPYSLYDWARIPTHYFFGLPFWAQFFDWGSSITGAATYSYESLTAGLVLHVLRGWGMAMAFYILARKVTFPSALIFASAQTAFYWLFFPIFVLPESKAPLVWWFTVWEAHLFFAVGLWFTPRAFAAYFK
jgi:hypothetical protein